jgi:DNA-binding transcriptional ArsR family regulator
VQQLTDEYRSLSMLELALEAYDVFHSDLDSPAVSAHLDALRHRVDLQITAEGLAEAARDFGMRYTLMRAIAERDDIIVTLHNKITELEGTIAWREGHLHASLDECDWRRITTTALQAEVQRLTAVVDSQDKLVGPFRLLIRLWHRVTRRS